MKGKAKYFQLRIGVLEFERTDIICSSRDDGDLPWVDEDTDSNKGWT